MNTVTVTLSDVDAAVLLYAARALTEKLGARATDSLSQAIKAFERQLPVELSRIVDARINK